MENFFRQFLILTILWPFYFPLDFVRSQCLQDQQSSLLRLKENLTFDPDLSSKLISWDPSTDCCSWIGVTCGSNGHVIGLDLSGESISDGIDSSSNLFGPDHLQIQSLNLASCTLTRFPAFLKDQVRLFELDLSNNQIGGEIPDWIWTFQYLKSLNLSHNLLVSSQQHHLVRTPLPSTIDLSNNNLQGELPKPPPSAVYVDYSSNNFSSVIPIEFGSYLKSAYFVSLSNNNLHGSIPRSICSATSLRVLNLLNNSLNGTIPQCLFGMENLGALNLGGNNLSGNISDTIPGNCELQTINFNGNQLEGKIPRSLANCRSLEVLDLGNNQINDVFPSHLEKVSSLRVLVLRSNNLHGAIDWVDDSSSWPVIQIVDLASNHLTGKLPVQCFRNWKGMMVDDVDFQDLHLKFFGFYYRDSITVTVKGLETHLVKILSIFSSIDFSCNNFEGKIPDEIGEFKPLFGLNLSHNALTGLIPSSIGNLGQLESLDLSINNLSGVIPQELAYLNFLAFLNLSNNHLVGRIPISTQIQSFANASFQGNDGLCGLPLTKRCGHDKDSCGLHNCRANAQPKSSHDKQIDDGSLIDWNFLSVELGFIFGLGIVILPLMFWSRWSIWYSRHVDVIISRLPPQLNQRSRNRGSRFPGR